MQVELEIARDLSTQVRNVQDAAFLWTLWAFEKGHEDPDTETYLAGIVDQVRGGSYSIFIARVNEEPVGMIDLTFSYEPGDRQTYAIVDKLYVKEEHRGTGIAKQLMEAAHVAANLCEVTRATVLAKPDGPIDVYRKYGFKDDMILLRYED